MSVKNENEVRVEKVIQAPAKAVFQAISEGRLFNNCGAPLEQLKIDFRSGGQYQLFFPNADARLCGKFLEIVPGKKVCFTWGDEGSDPGFPRSDVSIELFADGEKTRIVILHTGFKNKSEADNHDYGWNSGLGDLGSELAEGRIRIVRLYAVNRESLYRSCSDIRKFLGIVSDTKQGELDFRVGGIIDFPPRRGRSWVNSRKSFPERKSCFPGLQAVMGDLSAQPG